MENNTTQNIREEIDITLSSFLKEESEMLQESLDKYPKNIHTCFVSINYLINITKIAIPLNYKAELGEVFTLCFKNLNQALLFSSVYALRGNIRACSMEIRFAIETAFSLAYLLEKEEEAGELFQKVEQSIDYELNKKISEKVYEHFGKGHGLKKKKDMINEWFAHGGIPRYKNLDIKQGDGKDEFGIDMYDSKEFREQFLKKIIAFSSSVTHEICLTLCDSIEKKNAKDMKDYRKKIEENKKNLENLRSE